MSYKRIDTTQYGKYTIAVCEAPKNMFSFTAYLKKANTGKICHFEYENKEYGYEQIKVELDNIDSQKASLRKNNIPTTEEFVLALNAILANNKTNEKKFDMLKFHAQAPNRIATAEELAKSVGYDDLASANVHYGNLAKEICDILGYKPLETRNHKPIWTFAIAYNADDNLETKNDDVKNWRWALREEVYEAMKICGLII